MEVAGLVVAVLPSLKRAIHKYNECYQPLWRNSTFSNDVNQFRRTFLVQKSLFQTKCIRLLSCCMDGRMAAEMLRSVDHHLWSDVSVENRMRALLEDHTSVCADAVDMIQECVEEISTRCQRTWDALDQDTRGAEASGSFAGLKDKVMLRIQHGWSKDSMNQCLHKLKEQNSHFSALCDNLVNIHRDQAQRSFVKQNRTTHSLDDFPITNKAARKLYKALSKSCGKHPEHYAIVNVEVEQRHMVEDQKMQVKFTLGFSQPIDACAAHQTNISWLGMELTAFASISNESNPNLYRDEVPDRLSCSLKKGLGLHEAERQTKRVRLTHGGSVKDDTLPPTQAAQRAFSGLPIEHDLCDLIRHCEQQASDNRVCLGLLSTEDECVLSVHVLSKTDQSNRSSSTSLRCLLEKHSHQDVNTKLLLTDRLHMAKQLAIAILQFHSTPWLKSSWNSGDVYLVESQRGRYPVSKPPHLQTSICKQDGAQDFGEIEAVETQEASKETLLNLSIVLLELAHYAPFESLQTMMNSSPTFFDPDDTKRVVHEFSRSHHTDMGPAYHKIIEALAGGNQMGDFDFSDPQSQAAFYEQVICRLDRQERLLKKFHAEE